MNFLIYDKVAELCKEKGISQRQLQRDLNLSTSTVSRWKTSAPRPDTLQAVADYFNVSEDYLTGRTKYRNKEHMLQSFDLNYKPDMTDTKTPHDVCIQTDEGIVLVESMSPAPKYIDPDTRCVAEKIVVNARLRQIMEKLEQLPSNKFDAIYNMIKAMGDE